MIQRAWHPGLTDESLTNAELAARDALGLPASRNHSAPYGYSRDCSTHCACCDRGEFGYQQPDLFVEKIVNYLLRIRRLAAGVGAFFRQLLKFL